jgi:transcriptional regulator with XRE-family HTH domain
VPNVYDQRWTMAFSDRLRELIDRLKLSPEKFAAKVRTPDGEPLSIGTLQGWRYGRRMPKANMIGPLARALGVTTDVLLGEAPMPPPPPEKPRRPTQPPHTRKRAPTPRGR